MIDKGANPFVVSYGGYTWADETRNLSNLPPQKSVFFTTRPFEGQFKDGKKNGLGTQTKVNESIVKGVWKDDELQDMITYENLKALNKLNIE